MTIRLFGGMILYKFFEGMMDRVHGFVLAPPNLDMEIEVFQNNLYERFFLPYWDAMAPTVEECLEAIKNFRPRIYVDYPVKIYDTPQEQELIKRIRYWFPRGRIIRGRMVHPASLGSRKELVEKLILRCHFGVFFPFANGELDIKMCREMERTEKSNRLVFIIDRKGDIFMTKSVQQVLDLPASSGGIFSRQHFL